MRYLFGYCFCFELNLLMGKALKSETRNDYDMTGDSVILKMNLVLSSCLSCAGAMSDKVRIIKYLFPAELW